MAFFYFGCQLVRLKRSLPSRFLDGLLLKPLRLSSFWGSLRSPYRVRLVAEAFGFALVQVSLLFAKKRKGVFLRKPGGRK